ncbi:MAG TPA: glycosyltransferase [Lapillicoccus sp.]|nr:glycosyltransferase [Lapillicoccus sp.]
MRIALVSEHANPLSAVGGVDAGGQNVHVDALAGELVALGHTVTVFTRRDSERPPDRVTAPSGYVVEHVPAGPPTTIPKDDLLQHMPAFARYLEQSWAQDPMDIVHAHFWMSGVASVRAARRVDIPVLQTFHALGTVKRRHQGAADTSPTERIGFERRLCRQVDHVIATCSDEITELVTLGLPVSHSTVIPCGVDTSAFRPAAGGPVGRLDGDRLAYVGRLVERKGVGNVIEALESLPGATFDIAGGPPANQLDHDDEVQRLRRIADWHGVADRVRFLGAIGRHQVPALMRAADIVVDVPWYEPFGIVPVEAMACGRPVVGSAVGGLLDTVIPGVTGELVPARRPDLLASALEQLLDDPMRRADYGRAGRARAVKEFTWSRVAAATARVYAAVLGTRLTAEAAR